MLCLVHYGILGIDILFLKSNSSSAHKNLHQLLDSLLDLQDTLASNNKKAQHAMTSGIGSESEEKTLRCTTVANDEDIPSDVEEMEKPSDKEESPSLSQLASGGSRKRKRTVSSKTFREKRDYAGDIARGHEALRPYCHAVLSKWNEKTKLASGKVTSKVGVA